MLLQLSGIAIRMSVSKQENVILQSISVKMNFAFLLYFPDSKQVVLIQLQTLWNLCSV